MPVLTKCPICQADTTILNIHTDCPKCKSPIVLGNNQLCYTEKDGKFYYSTIKRKFDFSEVRYFKENLPDFGENIICVFPDLFYNVLEWSKEAEENYNKGTRLAFWIKY